MIDTILLLNNRVFNHTGIDNSALLRISARKQTHLRELHIDFSDSMIFGNDVKQKQSEAREKLIEIVIAAKEYSSTDYGRLEYINKYLIDNNLFDPNANLTREQAAVMLSRLADAIGKPLPNQAATFADNTAISAWAVENAGQVQAAGIMGGVGNNEFAPKDPYTREQSIITMIRLWNNSM